MNPIREKIEYGLTKGLLTILRYCPAAVVYGICRTFSAFFYTVAIRRRRITWANLNIAFPEFSVKETRRMARAAYNHFGQFMAESAMILCGRIQKSDLLNMVDGDEVSKLQELEQRTEKGILFITGHLGNFELLAHYTGTQMKRSGYVVARKGTNQLIDDRIVTPLRKSFGNGVIYKSRALPLIARALRKGQHIGLLIDIKTNTQQGIPVTFFGKETLAINSSAYLQIKLNIPVVPVAMVRVSPKRYKLIAGDPIPWDDNGKPQNEQISKLTQIHQSALENLIRQYPEQWLWMHDRWRLT
jgi:Kdo2-lipid IVA lauroyltransferase/acyltransferase